MNKILLCLIVLFLSGHTRAQSHVNSKMDWWSESRYGMFIHWGLYSQD